MISSKGVVEIVELNNDKPKEPGKIYVNKEVFISYNKDLIRFINIGDTISYSYVVTEIGEKTVNLLTYINVLSRKDGKGIIEPSLGYEGMIFTLTRIKKDLKTIKENLRRWEK